MALATSAIAAPIIGGLVSAGAGYGLSKLSGTGASQPATAMAPFSPAGINAGGFSTTFNDGRLTLAPTAERMRMVAGLQDVLGQQAGEFGGLRGMVAPGMSALRASRMAEIEGARERAIGNLRDNMARRRVLGSSFGQDAISRGEAEFAQLRDKTAAETFMQELQLTNELMNQQFQLQRQQVQTGIDELNLQADVATKLSAKTTETMQKDAAFRAELAMKEAQGRGQFFGALTQPLVAGVDEGAENYFTPKAPAPSPAPSGNFMAPASGTVTVGY